MLLFTKRAREKIALVNLFKRVKERWRENLYCNSFFSPCFFLLLCPKQKSESLFIALCKRGNKSLSSIFSKWVTREIHTQKPRSEFPTLSRIKCRGRGISRTKLHMPTPSSWCNDAEKRTSAHCLVLLLFRNSFYFLESLPDFCIAQN